MLTYTETKKKIWELEKQIDILERKESISVEQAEYCKHLKRLLKAYTIEHRKAARKDEKYAIR